MPMRDSQFTVHVSTSDYTLLGAGRCLCQIAHRELRRPAWIESTRLAARICAKEPEGLLVLTILEELPHVPGPAQRAEADEYASLITGMVSKSAVVIERDGFGSALIRSIITGMATLAKTSYPRRVFGEVAEAVRWLNQGVATPIELRALVTARAELRQRHQVA